MLSLRLPLRHANMRQMLLSLPNNGNVDTALLIVTLRATCCRHDTLHAMLF